jgi:biotin transport system substrate-specific component
VFVSPTGGYLIGYFFGSLASGMIMGRPTLAEKKTTLKQYLKIAAASFIGMALIDLIGAFQLMRLNHLSPLAAVLAGIVPFVPGDLIKTALLIPLTARLRPIAAQYIGETARG